MKKLLRSRKGEGYIDTCVGVIVFIMILVVAINVFSFITLKTEMDEICDELIETATYTGGFGDAFWDRDTELLDKYYYYDIETTAEKYYNSSYRKVQLGDTMSVEISVTTYLKGLGAIRIPVTVTVSKSGISEKYWK
jgi:hypothetical protein